MHTLDVRGAHACVCALCVHAYVRVGILEEGRLGSSLCSPWLIMWLINSRCQALHSSTPVIRLNTHTHTHILSHTHKTQLEAREKLKVYNTMTCSGGHFRDGEEKERAQEELEEGGVKRLREA